MFFDDGNEMIIVAKTIIHSALIETYPEKKNYFLNHKLTEEEYNQLKSLEKK